MHSSLKALLKKIPGSVWAYRFLTDYGDQTRWWARIVMNQETLQLVKSVNPETRSALEISGDGWKSRIAFNSYRSIDYPEYDICAGPILNEAFDIIIAEQVFEHLLWPCRAVRHVHQMLNEGGVFLLTTPFLCKIHGAPIDCSRWTELGLRHLLAEGGFDLGRIVTGSWGNRACVRGNFTRWSIYRPWHSLANEPDFP